MMISNLHMYDTPTTSNSSSSSAAAASSAASANGLDPNDFMTLLVAEIQNQDPTNPMDPTTFMSQLVDLNQLEQVTQINQVVQEYAPASTTSSSTPTSN
jgi:flagellar basal-body rod modification protein FlgD